MNPQKIRRAHANKNLDIRITIAAKTFVEEELNVIANFTTRKVWAKRLSDSSEELSVVDGGGTINALQFDRYMVRWERSPVQAGDLVIDGSKAYNVSTVEILDLNRWLILNCKELLSGIPTNIDIGN